MKASELIKELELLIKDYGDFSVATDDGHEVTAIYKEKGVYEKYIELYTFGGTDFHEV